LFPATINDRLIKAGFKKGSIAGFEWEAQIKSATEETKIVAQTVERASENYDMLINRLNELENRVDQPIKATVKSISEVAESSRTELSTAEGALKQSIAKQMNIVEKINPSARASIGWVLLGKVTDDRKAWDARTPHSTDLTPSGIRSGVNIKIRGDTYVRKEITKTERSSVPIIDVVKTGDTVEVIEVHYLSAKGGGFFVWAKVQNIKRS